MPTHRHHIDEVEQTARKFASRHIESTAMDVDHSDPGFPNEVFAHGIEAGFDVFVLPEDAGGFGFQTDALCSLLKTLAETCAGHAMVFGVHAAVIKSLFDAGDPDSRELIKGVSSSSRPIAVNIPEPLSFDDFQTDMRADGEDGGRFQLVGQGGLTINADPSGWSVVFVKTSDRVPLALLLHGNDESPILGDPEITLGLRAMPMAELKLDRVRVSRSQVFAQGEQAVRFYRLLLSNLCIVTAAVSAGLMKSAFEKALAYANERYQGGRMIIDHSHLRCILGEMSAGVTASTGAVFHAAMRTSDHGAVLGTKVSVTELAVKICTDAVQILGGYGYMRDYGLEKAMRDAAVLALLPISNARAEQLIAAIEKEAIS